MKISFLLAFCIYLIPLAQAPAASPPDVLVKSITRRSSANPQEDKTFRRGLEKGRRFDRGPRFVPQFRLYPHDPDRRWGRQLAGRLAGQQKHLARVSQTLLVRTYSTALSTTRQAIDYKPAARPSPRYRGHRCAPTSTIGVIQPVSIDYEIGKIPGRVESLRRSKVGGVSPCGQPTATPSRAKFASTA